MLNAFKTKLEGVLENAFEKQTDVQSIVFAEMLFYIEKELYALVAKYPFSKEFNILFDEKDFKNSDLFVHALNYVEEEKNLDLKYGSIKISQDIGCVRVDITLK